MVARFLTLLLAAYFRACIAHALSLPLEAAASDRFAHAPHWVCDGLGIFVAVLVVETTAVLFEQALRLWRRRVQDAKALTGLRPPLTPPGSQ